MKKHPYFHVAAALLAAGCSAAAVPGAGVPSASVRDATVRDATVRDATGQSGLAAIDVVPRFESAPLRVQAIVAPFTGNDVYHLVLKLFTVSGSTEAQVVGAGGKLLDQDVLASAFGGPLRFDRLHKETKYRVRGYAYKASGTADADRISVDSGSFVDVTVLNDDRPTAATLSIELKGKVFGGQGTGSVEFKPGQVNDAGDEKVE